MKKVFKPLVFLFLTGAGLFCFLYYWSGVLKPELPITPIQYSEALIEETEKLRDISFTPEDEYAVQKEVAYAEGASANWYPKSESPIFTELVEEGNLPPVAERVGTEPVVIEGVDGIGTYGGTWNYVSNSPKEIDVIRHVMSGASLVRWSPLGYPIVPHVAKSWKISPDKKEWTFYLRKGMKWSDGHPFTADDILYWWEGESEFIEHSHLEWIKIAGQIGNIIQVDPYTVKFVFPLPHSLLLERMASTFEYYSPKHYLEKYHPELGDDTLIESTMKAMNIPTRQGLYLKMKDHINPECPRIWPWVYHTYKANPPHFYVRNPYYWAVDPKGNQLPYIDRVMIDVKTVKLVPITAASGGLTMQGRHIYFKYYTLFMSEREANDYDVYHWQSDSRTVWTIYPNINRRVDSDDPITYMKWELLNDKRFRQALSLAINRPQIIDAVYYGVGEPAQVAPGRTSPFHNEKLLKSFTDYAPDHANQLLDAIGLTKRDREGYRTFKDGTRMVWILSFIPNFSGGPSPFVIEDWKNVGIRALAKERSMLFYVAEGRGRVTDFSVWGDGVIYPLISPRQYAPAHVGQSIARGFDNWYRDGGLYGNPAALKFGNLEPPRDHPLRYCMELLEDAYLAPTREEQIRIYNKIQDIAAENVWSISIASAPPRPMIVDKDLKNAPRKAVYGQSFLSPANGGLETFYFKSKRDSPGTIALIKKEITAITPMPQIVDTVTLETDKGNTLSRFVRNLCIGIAVLGLLLSGVRHPYIGRRLIIMVPTLFIISVITFIIIQLPPSNFIEAKLLQAEMDGDQQAIVEAEQLLKLYPLDQNGMAEYAQWLGLFWFGSFNSEDEGLLQGHLGYSMESRRPVNEVVGDRILLTLLITLGSILLTWSLALPIGIYSAVRQYSIGDYIFTLIGFIGMCVPSFLLALLFMYWGNIYFNISMTGLFSPEYAGQPEWSAGKIVDLMKHIWVPVTVLGLTGTASMIRVMRGNLLDELNKPYVTTAMAKGVRPFKLLIKYPVRIALNPFISGIGVLFPQLVSGGAIVAMVLSLPTVGPLMLNALMSEDMYLAGSMLMVLSLLGVFGTLVSDLLLMILDPRIRMERGNR